MGTGDGCIFDPNEIHEEWDGFFPLWEANPTKMLVCMQELINSFDLRFQYRSSLDGDDLVLYDRNLNLFLRRRIWSDFHYVPSRDRLLYKLFSPPRITYRDYDYDWKDMTRSRYYTAKAIDQDMLNDIGLRDDIEFGLDLGTILRIQVELLQRVETLDMGFLQVVDYVNGNGYSWLGISRLQVIGNVSRSLGISVYQVIYYCVLLLREGVMTMSIMLNDVDVLI